LLKVLSIIGTRPEAIKIAMLHRLMLEDDKFNPKLCSTGQHKTLLSEALSQFDLKTDTELDAMSNNTSLADQTAYVVKSLQSLCEAENPDLILVQGDTLSAYCGAMVAFYNKIKLAHIEAGLRTGNKWGPFPEEVNRRYIDMVADFHFAPTEIAKQNLESENVPFDNVFITGNTGIDALHHIVNNVKNNSHKISKDVKALLPDSGNTKMGLLTLHRRETNPETMTAIIEKLEAAAQNLNMEIIFPMHPNPLFQKSFSQFKNSKYIKCIAPLPYKSFVWLMQQSDIILTDSGGIQEEAPSLGKPVLVFRGETERQEILDLPSIKLGRLERIKEDITDLLSKPISPSHIYGNGQASQKIIAHLKSLLLS